MSSKYANLVGSTPEWIQFLEGVDKIVEQKGSIYLALDKAQEIFGFIKKDCIKHIANMFHTTSTEVYSIASFVAKYHFTRQGKYHIAVCIGTACRANGADKVLDEFKKQLKIEEDQTTEDGMFSISTVRCVGSCGLAPVVLSDNELHVKMSVEKVKGVLDSYRAKEK